MPSQVSSMLMILVLVMASCMYFWAHCYLRTRFFVEFWFRLIGFTFLQLRPKSSFMTAVISFLVASRPWVDLSSFRTASTESMNRFVVTISCIDSLSFSLLDSYSCLWDINSESMFGFLLTSLISLLMTKGETLIIFATSICYSFWIITMWTASTFWYKSSRLDFTLFRVSGLGSSFSSLFNSFFSFRIAIS